MAAGFLDPIGSGYAYGEYAAAAGAVEIRPSALEVLDSGLESGPRGGKVTLTQYNTKEGTPIFQRGSGEYFIYDENGKQLRVNSPTAHGNTLNDTPAELYQLIDRETGEIGVR